MDENQYIGRLFMWTMRSHDQDYISAADHEILRRTQLHGGQFVCEGQEGGFVSLYLNPIEEFWERYDPELLHYEFRVNIELLDHPSGTFRARPIIRFSVGQKVRTTDDFGGTRRQGWVRAVEWHHRLNANMYYIKVEGKTVSFRNISRRYAENELELVDGR